MAKKKVVIEIGAGTVCRFCVDGEGIPGLPHVVTRAQASGRGLLAVLNAALANGNYQADPGPIPEPIPVDEVPEIEIPEGA